MASEALRVQVEPQIPRYLNPFRPEAATQQRPKFVTNGSIGKAPYLRAIGIDLFATSDELKRATDAAEDSYHKKYGDDMFGPYMSQKGVSYPVVLASEKMKAAIGIMKKDGVNESFFTHDACYMLKFEGQEGKEITIHKPKTPQDRERVARLLYWASTTNNAHLYSVSGIVRYDEALKTVEVYSTEAELGKIEPFDMTQLLDNLKRNPTIALGSFTYTIPGMLTQRRDTIPVTVTRFRDGSTGDFSVNIFDPEWTALPIESARAEFAADTPQNIQLAGLGLIQW